MIKPTLAYRISGWRGGIRIHGDFHPGEYQIQFRPGLQSVDGGVFAPDANLHLTVPNRSARLKFLTDGRFVPRAAWGPLPLSHINVPKAQLTVRHIPQANMVQWLARGSQRVDALSSSVVARADLELNSLQREDTWIDLAKYVPNLQRDCTCRHRDGRRGRVWLTVTDLNLVAKLEKQTGSVLVTA